MAFVTDVINKRSELGWSQAALAQRAKVSTALIELMEQTGHIPRRENVLKIAAAVEIPPPAYQPKRRVLKKRALFLPTELIAHIRKQAKAGGLEVDEYVMLVTGFSSQPPRLGSDVYTPRLPEPQVHQKPPPRAARLKP